MWPIRTICRRRNSCQRLWRRRHSLLSSTNGSGEGESSKIAYAYLHGLGGSSRSAKAVALKEMIPSLRTPELNPPRFTDFTVSNALDIMDDLHLETSRREGDVRWRLIGSSLGGYVCAKWAERHPSLVDRMVLYCPAMDLPALWERYMGSEQIEKWRRSGSYPLAGPDGDVVDMSSDIIEDALLHHATCPSIPTECPTLIIHGDEDDLIPLEYSERLSRTSANISLLPVKNADHTMHSHIPILLFNTLKFLGNLERETRARS